MTQVPYPYKRLRPKRYIFISTGKKSIEKVVDFVPLGPGNIMNLAFGDLLPDGTIDDQVNSNNGDIIKVLATVIDILRHFTIQYPKAEIYFEGSTEERTKLYGRIIRTKPGGDRFVHEAPAEVYRHYACCGKKLYFTNFLSRYYYSTFNEEFLIAGVISMNNEINVIPYEPNGDQEYLGFLIKRNQ